MEKIFRKPVEEYIQIRNYVSEIQQGKRYYET